MPRNARTKSRSGIYHVILRGINRQQIFYDNEDYERFISTLSFYKRISGFELYCYCLMGNHVHLLIRDTGEPLAIIFRRIGASFVLWYNQKYDRIGHLFQDRFKSEAVDDRQYFFTVLRYILQNPVKAGICSCPDEYKYSSISEYMSDSAGITDISYALKMVDKEKLRVFLKQENDDICMESGSNSRRLPDDEALDLVKEVFGRVYINAEAVNRYELEEMIRRVIYTGVSIRQLSRISGLSKHLIENSMKGR